MRISLQGKTALIGGASRGIGRAIAEQMAEAGARVIGMARSENELQELKENLPADDGQRHSFLVVDFSEPEDLRKQVQTMMAEVRTVHILVNNTGGPAPGPVHKAAAEEYLSAFNQHLICNHILAKTLLEGMKAENYGRIINIISTSVKQPIPNLGVSNTVRGAVANWAKTLSMEVAQYGITVNNILPGATATQRLEAIVNNKAEKKGISPEEAEEQMKQEIPARRFAQPEELAYAACFLASPLAGYINGVNLPVDGGRTGCL